MHKLLHYLPFAIALVLCACAVFVTWKLARRWNAELHGAREYRAHLEGEAAAAAQLRAVMKQTVNANPQINIGSRVFTELRDTGRKRVTRGGVGAQCPLCSRSDCWLDCAAEVDERGPADQLLARTVAERSTTRLDQIVARTLGTTTRNRTPNLSRALDYSEELEAGDPGP